MARTYKRDASGRFAGGGGGTSGSTGARKSTRSTKGQRKAAMSNARNMLRADVKASRTNIEKGPASYQSQLRSALAASYRQRRNMIREAATGLGVARGRKKRK